MDLTDPIDVLARTLWAEARNQGIEGMHAVAACVMNRARRPSWWGKTVIGICLKPCQFSSWLKDDPNYPKLLAVTAEDPQFAEALVIAQAAAAGDLSDPTGGATSYYERHMKPAPAWAKDMRETTRIGDHIFFA